MTGIKSISRSLHLWTGLLCGMVFVVLGLTGSALAWIHELDHMLNPDLLQVAPPPGLVAGEPFRLSPVDVQAALGRLERDPQYGKPSQLFFPERAGDVIVAWYRQAPAPAGASFALAISRQVMLDPATLLITGERNWGETGFGRRLLMPTLFHLHRYLLAGAIGKTVVGVAGLVLIFIAVSGIILWWPKPTRAALWKAITVRYGGSWPRLNFSLHRAVGFFCAPLLLFQAFSGISFNEPSWTAPVIRIVGALTPPVKLANRSDPGVSRITPAQAFGAAQAWSPQSRVSRLVLPAKAGMPYELRLRQPKEVRQGDGATRVSIDSGDGRVLRVLDPLTARGGDQLVSWLFPLHTGEAFGNAGRIVISVFGLTPLLFFVTGVAVWLKRRKKRIPDRAPAPPLQSVRSAGPATTTSH